MANNIDWDASLEICDGLPDSVIAQYQSLCRDGWKFWVVTSSRGYCNMRRREITIPIFARTKGSLYYTWYFCHEMAHAIDRCRHQHGPEFMRILQDICPANCIHFELTYKPRNAQAAGIGFLDLSSF